MVDHHSHVCLHLPQCPICSLPMSITRIEPDPKFDRRDSLPTSAFRVTTWPRLLNEKVRPLLVTVAVARSRNSGTTSP